MQHILCWSTYLMVTSCSAMSLNPRLRRTDTQSLPVNVSKNLRSPSLRTRYAPHLLQFLWLHSSLWVRRSDIFCFMCETWDSHSERTKCPINWVHRLQRGKWSMEIWQRHSESGYPSNIVLSRPLVSRYISLWWEENNPPTEGVAGKWPEEHGRRRSRITRHLGN